MAALFRTPGSTPLAAAAGHGYDPENTYSRWALGNNDHMGKRASAKSSRSNKERDWEDSSSDTSVDLGHDRKRKNVRGPSLKSSREKKAKKEKKEKKHKKSKRHKYDRE